MYSLSLVIYLEVFILHLFFKDKKYNFNKHKHNVED